MVIDSGRRIEICQLCDNYHRLSLAFQDFMTYIFWQHLKLRYFWFLILELLFIEEPCKIQWLNFFVDLFLVGFIQVIWNFFIGFFIVQLFVCFTDISLTSIISLALPLSVLKRSCRVLSLDLSGYLLRFLSDFSQREFLFYLFFFL